MLKPKDATNPMLVVLGILISVTGARAQNNLAAKATSAQPSISKVESDRLRDGLAGPVRRVRTEVAKLSMINGKPTEEKRVVLETASYDIKGGKIENQYFPITGSTLTGKEVYKYDEKGNISEMTLLNSDGTLLGKEVYKYEYDSIGNWTRMTASVAVIEGGKVTFEPSEVTYRSIMYYLDENMLKMAQPVASTAAAETNPAIAKPQPAPGAESKSPAAPNPAANQATAASKSVSGLPSVHLSTNKDALNLTVLSANAASSVPKGTKVELDSEPPAVPKPQPSLKSVSGGVLNGQAVALPTPVYPDPAKRMRTSGTVTIQVVVDEEGRVISAQAMTGPAILRDAALQAALKARFSPTTLSGQPVKVTGVINYKFSLTQ